MKAFKIFFLISTVLFSFACEDVITVDLAEGDNQIVIDAWINNNPEPQTIRLRRTSSYFDASGNPLELGATVTIVDQNGKVYNFEDTNSTGDYTWIPPAGEVFGEVGMGYVLGIETRDGKQYGAVSLMNRTATVDSIAAVFEEESLGFPEGYYCEFFADDHVGEGDAYWIKTYKNGLFLNKPDEMNIAFDASFSPGVDGVAFITPIRSFVNRVPDPNDKSEDDGTVAPWAEGDSIRVEIHSINLDAYQFLIETRTQMTLGDAGIFAVPPSNVPTNIEVQNSTAAEDQPLGFFAVSAVSSMGRIIEE